MVAGVREPKEAKPDTKWLERRSHTWHVVVYTPRHLVPVLRKRKFVASLQTRDIRTAQTRRHAALEEFRQLFEQAAKEAQRRSASDPGTVAPGGGEPDWLASARRWRAAFERFHQGDAGALTTTREPEPGQTREENAVAVAESLVAEEAGDIEWRHGRAAAEAFTGIAYGTRTPLLHHLDAWLAEGGKKGPLNPRTAAQYRSDLEGFAAWCKRAGVPVTIEGITKDIAGRFVTEYLIGKKIHWATGNRKITAASSYWRWLLKRTAATVNPWQGQSLSKGSKAKNGDKPKRPFMDDEVVALLAGNADSELSDAMRVAALSGMRLEEIYRLTVADCAGGWFIVNRSKTEAGVRRVPIHPSLSGIVARRCEGKPGSAYLFHEPGPEREGRERSAALSKQFGHYRQRVGVHDKSEGRRQSRVDFHSWRRWFITQARNAGIDRAVVAAVVGHEAGNLTDDTYLGRFNDERLQACVEAVRLPDYSAVIFCNQA